jgi:uncharacterized protein YndB with AHSA1/START domain
MLKIMQNKKELTITSVFDAPRLLVWRAWCNPEILKRWWGPKNFTTPYCEIDFRVGGKYIMCMNSAEGKDFWSTGVYEEIVPLERIVCTDSFADKKGDVVGAAYYGMSAEFPLEMELTIKFDEIGGKTRLTLTHAGIPEKEREMCSVGWNESLNKLADVLISMKRPRTNDKT